MLELSELPPPSKAAEAGYYPDPLGSGRARWWNGAAWTATVGPKVEPDAPFDRPVPPPTKVCRRCAVQSQTFAPECPNCGRNYTRASGPQLVGIIAASLLLTVGGCGACIAIGIEAGEEELERTAITRDEFDAVPPGASREPVEARLGAPFDTDRDGDLVCLTYNEEGELFGDFYELCFEDGVLVSKDAY